MFENLPINESNLFYLLHFYFIYLLQWNNAFLNRKICFFHRITSHILSWNSITYNIVAYIFLLCRRNHMLKIRKSYIYKTRFPQKIYMRQKFTKMKTAIFFWLHISNSVQIDITILIQRTIVILTSTNHHSIRRKVKKSSIVLILHAYQ